MPYVFGGNPNVTITAINTGGGIACSRTSGKTPCFIQVSASAITATGTSLPYEDLEYIWNFGDPSGTEYFDNPGVGRGRVNANSRQTGPEAAYCYRTAGTFTVTLTIRGKNGSSYTTTTATQAITVTAFSASGGEYWADSTAGGTNAGTLANPFNTIAAINTAIASGDNKQLHVKRGSSFTGTVSLAPFGTNNITHAGLRIDVYGSGALPNFNISSGTNPALSMGNGGSSSPAPKSDVVFSNLHFSISGTATPTAVADVGAPGHASAAVSDIYFDNCTSEATVINAANNAFVTSPASLINKIGHWNSTVISPLTSSHSSTGVTLHATTWAFFVGGSIEGGTSGVGAARHHIYPIVQDHSLYRWIDFGSGPLRNYCINLDWDWDGVSFSYAQYHLIAENNFTGAERSHDASNGNNNPAQTLFKNLVCEKNRIHGLTGNGVVFFYCAESYTHRDNEWWDCTGGHLIYSDAVTLGSILTARIYRNKMYHPVTVNVNANLINLDSALWVNLHTITDNIFVDMRAIARCVAVPFTQQAGATINRNQYYAPSDSNSEFLYDVTTDKTFAEWQTAGFDANGSVANPNWLDPAIGAFGMPDGYRRINTNYVVA